jgi:hypothetical protein
MEKMTLSFINEGRAVVACLGTSRSLERKNLELQHGHAPSFEASPGIIAGINNGLEPSSRDPVPLEVIKMIGKKSEIANALVADEIVEPCHVRSRTCMTCSFGTTSKLLISSIMYVQPPLQRCSFEGIMT